MSTLTFVRSVTMQTIRKADGDWWRILSIWLVTMVLKYGIWCLLALIGISESRAQQRIHAVSPFSAGEVLRYKVTWSFIRLGTVIVEQRADSTNPGSFLVSMSVTSTPSLPFISVDFLNETLLSDDRQTITRETIFSGKDRSLQTMYSYEADRGLILAHEYNRGAVSSVDSLTAEEPCYDALGLFMTSRLLNGSGLSVTLPTLNDHSIRPTDLTFTTEPEEIEVDAFPSPIRCRRVMGNANWVGTSFAGMKGPFEGWISDDSAGIPLKARVKIFLGSIVLELESIERPGWKDPSTVLTASAH